MPDLVPTTALGDLTARTIRHGSLLLEENAALALASLSLRSGAQQPLPFGLVLPGPGRWVEGSPASALWIGPDQWLIEGPGLAETDFAAELKSLCPACTVTEQTDGFVGFEIRSEAGERAIVALMEKLVNIDASAFTPGSATRTGMEHMSVFLIRRAPERLAIIGMRSAAETLWHVVETAMSRQKESRT